MAERTAPTPDDHLPEEDLIAYLDGELDEKTTRKIEAKIAEDPATRRDAESLKKSYELLDHLPKPEPSPNFTNRTMTHIGLPASGGAPVFVPPTPSQAAAQTAPYVAASHPSAMALPHHRSWGVWSWAFATIAAAVLGYLGHLLARPHLDATDSAKRTSEQVRLLERLPLYLGVDDVAYLRLLAAPELFGETEETSETSRPSTDDSLTTAELAKLETLFKSYPLARQHQLQRLDEEFAALPDAEQKSLGAVLERYAIWLDRLPDAYRREILQAPAAVERLDKVMLVKSRLWKERLPHTLREKIQAAEEPQREQIIAEIKQREADRKRIGSLARAEWANIASDRKPWPFDSDDLTKRLDDYVETKLKPRLSQTELRELEALKKDVESEKRYWGWFVYGHALMRLNELHPGLPEPASGKIVKTVADLQTQHSDLWKRLNNKNAIGARRQLQNHPAHGRWPEFAEAVVKEANELQVVVRTPFGPCKPDDYTDTIVKFVKDELSPKLSPSERDDWKKLEGRWPEHSKRLMDLAKKHDLVVPGVSPPGPPSKWDSVYRRGMAGKK